MEFVQKMKAAVSAVFALLSSWLGVLAVPAVIMVLLNLTDYFTGIYAAHCRGELVCSDRGLRGIAKKVCMWLLIGVGAGLDWLLQSTAQSAGIAFPLHFLVASMVALWLICNEILSVLENIDAIGVPLPPFLRRITLWLQAKAQEQAEAQEKK